jgi:nucleoside-diphosphate-sugar epimerase
MNHVENQEFIIYRQAPILVTGAGGFIGSRVVQRLLQMGFTNIRCFVRSSRSASTLRAMNLGSGATQSVEIIQGNLLSREDCIRATRDVAVIFHLAAGRGEKSYPEAYLNSVVTTRNLIEAAISQGGLQRFVNISSFSVYSNIKKPRWRVLDESCPIETRPHLRGEAYVFAKVKQEELVAEYGKTCGLRYVTVRPGHVFGPGNEAMSGRVGIDTFGIFLHMGGSNEIPLTYVDNCAEAIVLAGVKPGVDGEAFNVVDDELPTSREFLRQYKRNVRRFRTVFVPHLFSYLLCWLWEGFSKWSEGELPPAFNRKRWHAFWKSTRYSNKHLKDRLNWRVSIPMKEGLRRYFEACSAKGSNA